jgi:hypothetical protein
VYVCERMCEYVCVVHYGKALGDSVTGFQNLPLW